LRIHERRRTIARASAVWFEIIEMTHFRVASAMLLACMLGANSARAADPASTLFTLASPAFSDNGVLPLKYAGGTLCGKDSRGGNTSPPLAWANPPAGTKSFAVVMIDPDGRRGLGSVHWVAYGIPASRTNLKEGEGGLAPAPDIIEGKNSRGTLGYTGPCGPPVDAAHHYVIDVIALDEAPNALKSGFGRDELLMAIAGHSLGPASLVVRYRRTP
jgi:Raf kinase inhibitor-like YbhB/YbcL family protein